MGELVVGRPTFQLSYRVSLPLDLVSYMSLLYRAVPGSGLHPSLIENRRALSDELRFDLDLLHGFSGRLLYFMEEPIMNYQPLRADHTEASFNELVDHLSNLPAIDYQQMALHSLERVHRDLQSGAAAPALDNMADWRMYLLPALTTASPEDAYHLILHPEELKAKVVNLVRGLWDSGYKQQFNKYASLLCQAAELASRTANQGFGFAFTELTGNRLPAPLVSRLNDVERVTFCPSAYLGTFVSYILYPPELVVYFGAPELIHRMKPSPASQRVVLTNGANHANGSAAGPPATQLGTDELLEALRALGDPNRLRILDLLSVGQLYAQEIVGRLGIAQSAVSRHLSLLERAGLVQVRPRGGMKYYELDRQQLDAVASSLRVRGSE
jgi:DNA-binding transcriptional ArsR family regulator